MDTTTQAATTRQPVQVEAYASALAQGARALSASGHAAAMAAVVTGDVLAGGGVVVKIPKKKPAATTTTTTTVTTTTAPAVVAGSGSVPPFCPIPVKARLAVAASTPPVQDRKKERVVVSSSDEEEDTIDVEDAQRERAYAQAEELSKRRLSATPPAKKKVKFIPSALATPARVLAELDPTNPWVAAANQVLAAAPAAAAEVQQQPPAEAPPPPTTTKKAAASAQPLAPKAPTKVLVRDKKTGKLTGKIDNVVKREKRRTMGPNRDLVLRKVQVDIYQRANRADSLHKRLVHVKIVLWNLREYRKRLDIAVENPAVRARLLDRRQLQFPLQVQVYGATLNFVANEDLRANSKTLGIFSVNTDAPTYRDDLYRAAMADGRAPDRAAGRPLPRGQRRGRALERESAPSARLARKTRRTVAFWAREAPIGVVLLCD